MQAAGRFLQLSGICSRYPDSGNFLCGKSYDKASRKRYFKVSDVLNLLIL